MARRRKSACIDMQIASIKYKNVDINNTTLIMLTIVYYYADFTLNDPKKSSSVPPIRRPCGSTFYGLLHTGIKAMCDFATSSAPLTPRAFDTRWRRGIDADFSIATNSDAAGLAA
jgi:hypothetical protein